MSHTVRDKKRLLSRVHRIQGQLAALERRLAEEDDDCHAILQLAAACRGALNSLTIEIIEGHIRHHVVNPDDTPHSGQAVAARQLLEVLRAYMR